MVYLLRKNSGVVMDNLLVIESWWEKELVGMQGSGGVKDGVLVMARIQQRNTVRVPVAMLKEFVVLDFFSRNFRS